MLVSWLKGLHRSRLAWRWVVRVVVVMLALQSSWVAATQTCGHESGPAQDHFGHHVHEHATPEEAASAVLQAADADCGDCHLSGHPLMLLVNDRTPLRATQPVPAVAPAAAWNVMPPRPERPKWRQTL